MRGKGNPLKEIDCLYAWRYRYTRTWRTSKLKDVEFFIEHTVYDFAKRVDKNRKLSKPVAESHYYIFKHIYEDLSPTKIAEYVSTKYPNNRIHATIKYWSGKKTAYLYRLSTIENPSIPKLYRPKLLTKVLKNIQS